MHSKVTTRMALNLHGTRTADGLLCIYRVGYSPLSYVRWEVTTCQSNNVKLQLLQKIAFNTTGWDYMASNANANVDVTAHN